MMKHMVMSLIIMKQMLQYEDFKNMAVELDNIIGE